MLAAPVGRRGRWNAPSECVSVDCGCDGLDPAMCQQELIVQMLSWTLYIEMLH